MEILIGYFILYVIQAILIYGMSFAHFQRRWPSLANKDRRGDINISIILALVGAILPVIGVLLILVLADRCRYGLKYR